MYHNFKYWPLFSFHNTFTNNISKGIDTFQMWWDLRYHYLRIYC